MTDPTPASPSAPATFPAPYRPPYGPAAPQPGFGPPAPHSRPPRRSSAAGIIALVAGLFALIVPTVVGAVAAFRIGEGAGAEIARQPLSTDLSLEALSPVRDWVLVGEIAFWAGTVIGVWAIVQGIIALVQARGRVWAAVGIAAAVLGPLVFGLAVWAALTASYPAGLAGA